MSNEYGLSAQAQTLLDKVRLLFGADKVSVTSGHRSVANNASLAGSSRTSQHLTGDAFDFRVKGMTPAQVQTIVAKSGIPFGQSIQEYGAAAGAGVNHLGVGSKGQLLTANNGKYSVTGYADQIANKTAEQTRGWVANTMARVFGEQNLHDLGENLSAPGDAINGSLSTLDPSQWFERIALGLLALLFIGVAIVMLTGKSVTQIAGKIPPIPV